MGNINPTVGRIVFYRLTHEDLEGIKAVTMRRVRPGNPHYVGQALPMLVTAVWPAKRDTYSEPPKMVAGKVVYYGEDFKGISGQVFVDDDFSFWVRNIEEGVGENVGFWYWPVAPANATSNAPVGVTPNIQSSDLSYRDSQKEKKPIE